MSDWKSLITGYGDERPDQLVANPDNWRIHPADQQDVTGSYLEARGWLQTVIVNTETGHLVDGHMRVMLAMRANQPTIPVTYITCDLDTERALLATLDRIGLQAEADAEQLRRLTDGLIPADETLDYFLQDLLERATGPEVLPAQPTDAAYAPNPWEDKVPVQRDGDGPQDYTSKYDTLRLWFDEAQNEYVRRSLTILADDYGTESVTETLYAAVEKAHETRFPDSVPSHED